MAAVHRHADAAAHVDAVDQRDVRLRIALDRGVEDVFVAVELERIGRFRLPGFIQRANVTARAEGPVAVAANSDGFDRIVFGPFVKLRFHCHAHALRQRVQRLWAIERDEAERATALEQDFGFFRHCRNISRATITRMISLVPSSI